MNATDNKSVVPSMIVESRRIDEIIDDVFSNLLSPLSSEAYEGLKANIESDGLREAIIVWKEGGRDILIDGHNRLKICKELGYTEIKVTNKNFDSQRDAEIWILLNQMHRRNLNKYQWTYHIGEFYQQLKQSQGGDRKSQKSKCENRTLISDTGKFLADKFKVSIRTVKEASEFKNCVDFIESKREGTSLPSKDELLSGNYTMKEIKDTTKDLKKSNGSCPSKENKFEVMEESISESSSQNSYSEKNEKSSFPDKATEPITMPISNASVNVTSTKKETVSYIDDKPIGNEVPLPHTVSTADNTPCNVISQDSETVIVKIVKADKLESNTYGNYSGGGKINFLILHDFSFFYRNKII